jgi:hypothetical protein
LGIPDNFGHFASIGEEKNEEIGAVYDNSASLTWGIPCLEALAFVSKHSVLLVLFVEELAKMI